MREASRNLRVPSHRYPNYLDEFLSHSEFPSFSGFFFELKMAFAVTNPPLLRYSCDSPPFPSTLHITQHPSSLNSASSSVIINHRVLRLDCRKRRAVTINCQSTAEKSVVSRNRMLVFVPPHPLIKHWVSVLRNEQTPCPVFKNAMAELGRLLIYEASRDWLPTISGEIQSPMGAAAVEFIDPREPIVVIPVLRAGLALAEHAASVLPATKTYHLGLSRNEETLQPTVYLNKLPEKFSEGSRVFIVDPMLATGGTVVAAVQLIKDRGVDNKQIKVICAVAAPPALQKLSEKFPGLHVYAGILDATVNEKGFIIPGLGDAGDRSFGT